MLMGGMVLAGLLALGTLLLLPSGGGRSGKNAAGAGANEAGRTSANQATRTAPLGGSTEEDRGRAGEADGGTRDASGNQPIVREERPRLSELFSDAMTTRTLLMASDGTGGATAGHRSTMPVNPPRPRGDDDERQDELENATAAVMGMVRNSAGLPAVGVQIAITEVETERRIAMVRTDTQGIYSSPLQVPGKYAVQPSVPVGHVAPPPVRVEAADGVVVRADFVMLTEGDTIAGSVKNQKGEPLAGAKVHVMYRLSHGSGTAAYEADEEGAFLIEGVPVDQPVQSIAVSHPGYETETRREVTTWDGRQDFVLKPMSNLLMAVQWQADGSPVTHYAYRLLRRGVMGFEVDHRRPDVVVNDVDGLARINEVISGTWRVEVTVLDAGGQATPLRGAEMVDLDKPVEGQRYLLVEIAGGQLLQGTVVAFDGRTPVAGAAVEIVPPAEVGPQVTRPDMSYKSTVTDAAGRFEFDGMPPGQFTIVATKDLLQARAPLDVTIVGGTDPTPVRIVLQEGAEVTGVVIGSDENPAPADHTMTLHYIPVNGSQWARRPGKTDRDGRYSFAGLPAGAYYVSTNDPAGGRYEMPQFLLDIGQRKVLDFNFSETIEVVGTVRMGGQPLANSGAHFMNFISSGGQVSGWVAIESQGQYRARLTPGRYRARLALPSRSVLGEGPLFVVQDEPARQTVDQDFELADADFLLVFEDPESFAPGTLVLAPRDRHTTYQFYRFDVSNASRRVTSLIGGEYEASFTSTDREWRGDSGLITIAAGAENTFTIDVSRNDSWARIGEWATDQVGQTEATYSFNATGHVRSTGTVEILVQYEGGRHAVFITSVALQRNGATVGIDQHHGWSGVDRWANTYRVALDQAPQGATYTVLVTMRSDGGSDSRGGVLLRVVR
ncbi:MAG: carboxypeptidase regulatory-like domain-containing protein [Candidatus Sumerlaeia bacterium]|nr:carboxypeptidase regulatory-like domain-containing protein [Candidatus Sumerlaeia bacterium]